MIRPERKQTR